VSAAKFASLRARYLTAVGKREELESRLTSKYSSAWKRDWLSTAERHALERLGAAVDKASDAFFAHLQSISPRDWSSGVPVHWLYTDLSYEDAVRPVGEKLSVTPPLAYGATGVMR
jgi:hypothetical protein